MMMHNRDKRGVEAVTLQYNAVRASEYVDLFLKQKDNVVERPQVVPFLVRVLQESHIDLEVRADLMEAALEWLNELGVTVDDENTDLAEDLTLLVTHCLLTLAADVGPADNRETAAEAAESFATRIVEARAAQTALINVTSSALYALAQVYDLPNSHRSFSAAVFRILSECRDRERVLRVLPYLLSFAPGAADAALVTALGGMIAHGLGANDEATAMAAVDALPIVVEIFGAEAAGLTQVMESLDAYPKATQTNVSRNGLRNAIGEIVTGFEDLGAVERIVTLTSHAVVPLVGFAATRRQQFIERLYRGLAQVPKALHQPLFGAASVRQSELLAGRHGKDPDLVKEQAVRERETGRQRARDAKAGAAGDEGEY